MAQNPHRYFVTYVAPTGVIGNTEIDLRLPIRGMADVRLLTKLLADAGLPGAVVTGWQRFEQ